MSEEKRCKREEGVTSSMGDEGVITQRARRRES
jgi:hypothetical protein